MDTFMCARKKQNVQGEFSNQSVSFFSAKTCRLSVIVKGLVLYVPFSQNSTLFAFNNPC